MNFMLFMSMFSLVMMVHVFHDHGVYFLMLVVHDFFAYIGSWRYHVQVVFHVFIVHGGS